jgi:hypothetical protein
MGSSENWCDIRHVYMRFSPFPDKNKNVCATRPSNKRRSPQTALEQSIAGK